MGRHTKRGNGSPAWMREVITHAALLERAARMLVLQHGDTVPGKGKMEGHVNEKQWEQQLKRKIVGGEGKSL